MAALKEQLIDYASARTVKPGQAQCGDQQVVVSVPNGVVIAAIDGLGSGPQAAEAADQAAEAVRRHAACESLDILLARCHSDLQETRGVVMNVARINADRETLSWLGIGDVEGRLLFQSSSSGYAPKSLMARSGVVGDRHQLPHCGTSISRLRHGDMLIFATDGIYRGFADDLDISHSVQDIAEHIISHFRKPSDDALVLVVRYLG